MIYLHSALPIVGTFISSISLPNVFYRLDF